MPASEQSFYDDLAPLYHLIFEDWEASIARQGEWLESVLRSEWAGHGSILDISCGIGTQSIALARRGFQVRGSDLSPGAVARAGREAASRGLSIEFSVCDMREAFEHHGGGFDVVISCDNSIPHLLTDADISRALEQMRECLRPGGGCLLTVRDYDREPRGTNLVKPYGVRIENGKRFLGLQIWDFDGDQYDLTLFFLEEDLATRETAVRSMRSRYYAIGAEKLQDLMTRAGFAGVRRLDGAFYQPVLIGTRPSGD